MVFACDLCPKEFATSSDLARHKDRKIPCNAGKFLCSGCDLRFTTNKAKKAHEASGCCKGKRPQVLLRELQVAEAEQAEELQDTQETLEDLEAEHQLLKAKYRALEDEHFVLKSDHQRLAVAHDHQTLELARLNANYDSVSDELARAHVKLGTGGFDDVYMRRQFVYDRNELHEKGLYLIHVSGMTVTDLPANAIVAKFGRAVEQSIAKRSSDTIGLHPDNCLLYIKACKDPGDAERKLKVSLKTNNLRRTGTSASGTKSNELVVFRPEQANMIRRLFDVAACQ